MRIGAASRTKLWIGLEDTGAVGADSAAGASLVTTLDVAISGFGEAMLGGWRGKRRGR